MDLALLVYSISLLAGFNKLFVASVAICGIYIICQWIYWAGTYDSDKIIAGCIKRAKIAFWVGLFSCIMLILLPSERTAYTMVGAYAAQKVSENEKVQQLSGKVLTIIEQKLDGYIDEGVEKAKDVVKEKVSK